MLPETPLQLMAQLGSGLDEWLPVVQAKLFPSSI
jgi:hypothetical protein